MKSKQYFSDFGIDIDANLAVSCFFVETDYDVNFYILIDKLSRDEKQWMIACFSTGNQKDL